MPGKDLSFLRDQIPQDGDTSWGEGALNIVLEGLLDDAEPSVRASEITIDDELEMDGNTLVDAGSVQFLNLNSELSSVLDTCKLYVVDGELTYTDDDANVLRISLNGALDISSTGGFTGDYGDSGSTASYSDVSKVFTFEQGGGLTGHLRGDQFQLQNGASATRVTLEAPASLATSYTWTFPTALPTTGTSIVQVSTTGQLSQTRDPTVDTLATTGTATLATLAVTGATTATGLITAQAGVTAASDQHMTVQGTGRYRRGSLSCTLPALGFSSIGTATSAGGFTNANAAEIYRVPLTLHDGERLVSISSRVTPTVGQQITFQLARVTDGAVAIVAAVVSSTSGLVQTLTLSSLTETMGSGGTISYYARYTFTGTGNDIHNITPTTDVP